jgi:hypothetical protein
MRLVALVGLLAAASVVSAQDATKPYPIFTADQLDATMKTVGPNVVGLRAALAADDLELAKERGIRAREQLATTMTFWRDRERDDAVGLLRDVLRSFDALDTALSRDAVDRGAVDRLSTEIGSGCAACHASYRREGPDGGYLLNESALR